MRVANAASVKAFRVVPGYRVVTDQGKIYLYETYAEALSVFEILRKARRLAKLEKIEHGK